MARAAQEQDMVIVESDIDEDMVSDEEFRDNMLGIHIALTGQSYENYENHRTYQ